MTWWLRRAPLPSGAEHVMLVTCLRCGTQRSHLEQCECPAPSSSKDPAEHFEQAARDEIARAHDELPTAGGFRYAARMSTAERLLGYARLFTEAKQLGVDEKVVVEAVRDALIQEIEDLLEAIP